MQRFKTYHSPIYRGFKAIESEDFRTVARYFEDNEKEIINLEFDEYFELLVAYTHSLFEIGQYVKHTLMADVVVEASILQNVQYFRGEDVYFVTLFKKAASFYNLYENKKAERILHELVKMDPYHQETVTFYKKCLEEQKNSFVKRMRAGAMFLFLITPLFIAAEVLFVQPFAEAQLNMIRASWKITFLLGWVFYLSGDLLHRYRQHRKVDRLVEKIKTKKHNRSQSF